jgi:hypothetical protein
MTQTQIIVNLEEEELGLLKAVLFSRSQSLDKIHRTPEMLLKEHIDIAIANCQPDYQPTKGLASGASAESTLDSQRKRVLFTLVDLIKTRNEVPTIINLKSRAAMSLQTVVATLCRLGLYGLVRKDQNDDADYDLKALKSHPLLACEFEVTA